jgi:hypothetical protein
MISGMTKTKSTFGNALAQIRYRPGGNSLARALDLCQELQGISSYTQIVNKREGVSWGDTDQSYHSIQVCLEGES